jgi:iron complex outermembrane recepter protein
MLHTVALNSSHKKNLFAYEEPPLEGYLRKQAGQDVKRQVNIDNIEFFSNPGAAYDAAGSGGVISIHLKKNKELGANASFTAGLAQGITLKGNGSGNLNYRGKKFNLFSSATINVGKYETRIRAHRVQKDTIYDQRLRQFRDINNYSVRAGVDYVINSKSVIGVLSDASFNNEDWSSYGNTPVLTGENKTYVTALRALSTGPRKRNLVNTNLNYRYISEKGNEINMDLDHGFFSGRSNSFQPNEYINEGGAVVSEVITHYNTPTDINIYTAKVDLMKSVKMGTINVGARFARVITTNTFEVFTDINGETLKVLDRSNDFSYDENVNAAYVTFKGTLGPVMNFDVGVRTEQTLSKGILERHDDLIQLDSKVKKKYLDFFPSAEVSWSITQNQSLLLSYSRRIDRPVYQDLNPFEMKLDELTYVKGNSFLKPQYSDKVSLSHTWKQMLTTAVGLTSIKDFMTQVNDTIGNSTYAQQRNLSSLNSFSLSVSSPLTITKWWTGFASFFFNYQMFQGSIGDKPVEINASVYGANMQHSFALGHDFKVEMVGWLSRSRPVVTWKTRPFGALDIGVEKQFFANRASLKFSMTDLFRTSIPFRGTTDFGGLFMDVWVMGENHTAKINFTYRLGSNHVRSLRQRQSGIESESQRVKN